MPYIIKNIYTIEMSIGIFQSIKEKPLLISRLEVEIINIYCCIIINGINIIEMSQA